MDDVDEYIRHEMERLNDNSTATSGSSRPSVPVQHFQPSPETVQQPDRDRNTEPRIVYFSEVDATVVPVPPVSSMSRTCVGVGTFPSPSNEPYRVMVEEPVNRRRQGAAPVGSASRDCAGVASVSNQDSNDPTVEIIEPPVRCRRFRYDTEIVSAGAIQGVHSTKDQKSFPKIKIENYVGPAEITVSLVCKDVPYRVHPNGIVGKKKSSEENFTYIYVKRVQVTRKNCVIQFDDLGIRIVRPNQIEGALRLRETQKVDPFGQGFNHKFDPKSDDLQAVRLCFQVKLAQEQNLDPVVSDIIYHYKNCTLGCLQINKVITSGPIVIFFSQPQKLNPKDVEVVFYEKENGKVVWERCVRKFDISDTSGIVCAVPPYTRATIEYDTEVNVMLRRLSDGTCGDPRPFTYYADSDAINKRKRKMAKRMVQDFVKKNWTPPTSLPPDNDSQYDQNWRRMPGPFDDNETMPGPSSVNPAGPEPSSVNPAGPEPSTINPVVPGPSSVNAAVSGLNHVNSAVPRPSHVNPAAAVPEPGFVNSTMPGLVAVNPFLSEPTEWRPMQTNLSMSPDMVPSISQPMSVTEDEGFFSPNGNFDKDGEYPGEDGSRRCKYTYVTI